MDLEELPFLFFRILYKIVNITGNLSPSQEAEQNRLSIQNVYNVNDVKKGGDVIKYGVYEDEDGKELAGNVHTQGDHNPLQLVHNVFKKYGLG